jgi:hypothetical protein
MVMVLIGPIGLGEGRRDDVMVMVLIGPIGLGGRDEEFVPSCDNILCRNRSRNLRTHAKIPIISRSCAHVGNLPLQCTLIFPKILYLSKNKIKIKY